MIFSESLSNYTTHQFVSFYREAKTIHDIDSPFVYDFCKYIVEDDRNFYIFPLARIFFREAKVNGQALYSMAPLTGKRLFRAVHHFKPGEALEIGVGDGLSTVYQATAMLSGELLSIEPNQAYAAFAKKRIEQLGLPNVEIKNQAPTKALSDNLEKREQLDFVFFHQATSAAIQLELVQQLLPKILPNCVIVVSGIYRTAEHSVAWKWMQKRSPVTLSIDLFDLGFLFFDPAFREKQHYKIIPKRWKFWRFGLFR